ncbi:MAG: L-aspartate oxidase, partial [Endomicrobia bacterium]|nr:L-aspartate oxidase [Endomicrobiia bacterium]
VFEDSKVLLDKQYPEFLAKNTYINNSLSNDSNAFVQDWEEARRLTWNYLGISRSNEMLEKAEKRINILKDEIEEHFKNSNLTVDRIEVRNIIAVAEMIVRCAMLRKESRGLHYNTDYPFMLPEAKDTVITAK